MEEILRMVKTDQERAQEARAHYKMEEEQTKWVEDKGPKVFGPWLTTGDGSRTKAQATSSKLQAASVKQQAWQDNIIRI